MAKVSQIQIDHDEKRILNLISSNKNMNVDEISKKLGFSKQKVYRILRKYKKNNIINTSISKNTDIKRYFFVLAKRTNIPMSNSYIEQKLINKLRSNFDNKSGIRVNCCFSTNGFSDLLFFISAKNILQTREFCNIISSSFSEYVSKIDIIELLSPIEKKQYFNKSNALK